MHGKVICEELFVHDFEYSIGGFRGGRNRRPF